MSWRLTAAGERRTVVFGRPVARILIIVTGTNNVFDRPQPLRPSLRPDEIAPERRRDRVLVRLPGGHLAWVAMTPRAAEALRREDRVLALVAARCGFAVPAVLTTSDAGCTIRSTVPGRVDAEGLAAWLKREPALISRIGTTLARVLAEQHTRIRAADVAGWLPTRPPWPLPHRVILDGLPHGCADAALRLRIERLLDACDDLGTEPEGCALIHSDFGLHNIAFDPITGAINGVFDYGSAARADRHLDFRYLVFGVVPDALLDVVAAAYREMTGFAIDRRRVLLCNAAAAVSHLADRVGHGPDAVVAGRTLAGDLRWTRWAVARAGF